MIKNVNLFGENRVPVINKLIGFNELTQAIENEREAIYFGFSISENFIELRKKHEISSKFILILNSKDKKATWNVMQ